MVQKRETSSNVIADKVAQARQDIIDGLPLEKYLISHNLVYGEVQGEGRMVCPVHDDNNPSCHYNTDKNVYHCFACGSKGSVVELDFGIKKRLNDRHSMVKTILELSREYDIHIANMFEYEKTNKPKRKKVTKFSERPLSPDKEERIYFRKLEKIEQLLRNPIGGTLEDPVYLTVQQKIIVYHNIDKVLLQEVSAKEMHEKIVNFINNC